MISIALIAAAAIGPAMQSAPGSGTGVPLDTTITTTAKQLRVDASAGRLTVRVWDQNAVHIIVHPQPNTRARIEASPTLVSVSGSAGGRIDEAEYQVTVPRRMAVTIGGGDMAIDIAGCEADVTARNYSGKLTVAGVKGSIVLKSVLGEIAVQESTGSVAAQTQQAAIRLTDVTGSVNVEGTWNHIYLTRVNAKALTASTIAGVIWFSGPLHVDGRYSLSTHDGSVFFTLPQPVDATFHVSTVSGAFTTTLPSTREDGPRRGRFTVRVGKGSANVDVETFNGGVVVRPDGE